MNKKYYLTTAIAYTSSKPHIGNTYEAVLADAVARFKKEQGFDVYFQTGNLKFWLIFFVYFCNSITNFMNCCI